MITKYSQKIADGKERKIKLVEEFYTLNGRLPKRAEKYKEVALGTFLNSIKQGSTKITEEQLKRLIALGFDINIKDIAEEKERKIKLIEEFYKEYGRLPKEAEKYKEVALGMFLNNIKQGTTTIAEEQLKRLIALGFDINVKDREEEKERKIRLVEEFYKEYGRLPKEAEEYKEVALGTFLNSIKQGSTKIREEQMNRLQKLGFQGQVNDVKIENSVFQISQFYRKYKRLPEPGESLKRERNKVGDILLSIKTGKIRITESQFLRLQQMDVALTREQVKFFKKPHTYIKK